LTAPPAAAAPQVEEASQNMEWVPVVSDTTAKMPAKKLTSILLVKKAQPGEASEGMQSNPVSEIIKATKTKKRKARLLKPDPVAEVRMYIKDSLPNEFLIDKSQVGGTLIHASDLPASASSSKEGAFTGAVQQGNLKDAILLLEEGAAANMSKELDKMRKAVKEKLGTLRHGHGTLEHWRFEMMDTLVKICINIEHYLKQSKALKSWLCFDVELAQIDNVCVRTSCPLDVSGSKFGVKAVFYVRDKTETWEYEAKVFQKTIAYTNPHNRLLNYNLALPDLQRKLQFQFVGLSSRGTVELGSATLELSELHQKCKPNGEWSDITIQGAGRHLLHKTTLKIKVRRNLENEGRLRHDKKMETLQKVQEWVRKIHSFNKNLAKRQMGKLSANIRIGHGSLLQAAVYLENIELVEELVGMGADPMAKTTSMGGSALQLAMNLSDGKEKKNSDAVPVTAIVNALQGRPAQVQAPIHPAQLHSYALAPHQASHAPRAQIHAANNHNLARAAPYKVGRPAQLPTLDRTWLIPQDLRQRVCRFQESTASGCRSRGSSVPKKCFFIHICKQIGPQLEEIWERSSKQLPMDPTNFYNSAQIRQEKDSLGHMWYTAALGRNLGKPNENRDVFLAEGGLTGERAPSGVWWYPSENAAREALAKVVVASHVVGLDRSRMAQHTSQFTRNNY